jgi:hypothetical protein
MARRRARFGKLPRVAQSLGPTILAAAAQMESQRDQNVMDAWKNGGTFEGKPVTDEVALAYWRGREVGMDPKDPAYEALSNTVTQLDYGIHQSKEDLLYKQGKISDRTYANFFLDWSKKVPKNSEFWRTLQKDAAQFIQHAAASGRAGSARGKAAAFNTYQDSINKKYTGLGSLLTDWMTRVAQSYNLIGKNEELDKFVLKGENDPGRMEQLLSLINEDRKANPGNYVQFDAAIKQFDPHWDGQITSEYFGRALKNQITGYQLLQTAAIKAGYSTQAKAAAKALGQTNDLAGQVDSWPTAAAYSIARDKFENVMKDPSATDLDKWNAAQSFATSAEGFAKKPGLDPAMSQRLGNDAACWRGSQDCQNQDSFYENYLGLTSPGSSQPAVDASTGVKATGENAKAQKDMALIGFWRQQYEANPGAYVYAHYVLDSAGNPTYDPKEAGPIGIVPLASVASSPNNNSVIPVVTVTGDTIMQVVTKKDIVVDDPFDSSSHTVIGQSITFNEGGVQRTLYGIPRDGVMDWTAVSPFSQDVNAAVKPDGIHLTVNPAVLGIDNAAAADAAGRPDIAAAFANGALPAEGTKWTQEGAVAGNQRTDTTITFSHGRLMQGTDQVSLDEKGHQTAATSTPGQPLTGATGQGLVDAVWDQSRLKAGPNPAIDFSTEIMAAVTAAAPTSDAMRSIWSNPQFQYALQQQEIALSGGDAIKLAQIAHVDRGIGNQLLGFGPDASPAINVDPARPSSRQDLLYPTAAEQQGVQAIGDTILKLGKALVVPGAPPTAQAGAGPTGLLQTGVDYLNRLTAGQINVAPAAPAVSPLTAPTAPGPITPPNLNPMANAIHPVVAPPVVTAPLPVLPPGVAGTAGKVAPPTPLPLPPSGAGRKPKPI